MEKGWKGNGPGLGPRAHPGPRARAPDYGPIRAITGPGPRAIPSPGPGSRSRALGPSGPQARAPRPLAPSHPEPAGPGPDMPRPWSGPWAAGPGPRARAPGPDWPGPRAPRPGPGPRPGHPGPSWAIPGPGPKPRAPGPRPRARARAPGPGPGLRALGPGFGALGPSGPGARAHAGASGPCRRAKPGARGYPYGYPGLGSEGRARGPGPRAGHGRIWPGPGPDRRAPGARGTGAARQRGVRMLSYVLFARGCRLRGRGILLGGRQGESDPRHSLETSNSIRPIRLPSFFIAPSPAYCTAMSSTHHFEGSKPTGRFGLAVLRT